MRAWLARLAAVGSPGCQLGTMLENTRGVAFFRRQGFAPHGEPRLAPGMRTPGGDRMHILFMVRDLERHAPAPPPDNLTS